jgi:mono/diheme cytochrome c family protein
MRIVGVVSVLALLALGAHAQPPERPQFDGEAVKRGQALQVERCGFCHGSNARGGAGGSDLTRSALVAEDEGGKQLGEFLKLGRPERNMPAFPDLTDAQVKDLAEFLHEAIYAAANRGGYKILDILVGDAKAGEAYFNANCASCHSASGDLKGVGAKYDPVALQQRMLMPRGGGRRGQGPGGRPNPPYMEPTATRAAVKLASGETIHGALLGVTDFQVVIWDPQADKLRSFLRHDGVPAVELTDPLQAHIDMWKKWTDSDMHNVTAYLAGLK